MAFFASLAMKLEPIEKPKEFFPFNQGTVATDGDKFYYESDFWDTLTIDEQVFCWAHEVMHAASGHLYRRGSRDPMGWNIAGDLCINDVLKECGLTMPKMGLLEVNGVTGHNDYAESVYEKLPKSAKQSCGCVWIGPSLPNQTGDGGAGNEGCNKSMEYEAAKWRDAVVQAEQIAKSIGELPGALGAFATAAKPKVNWKEKLRNWLGQRAKIDYNWLPSNRRYIYRGLYLPSQSGIHLEFALIADTSGSIGEKEANQVLGELKALKATGKVTVRILDVDTQVHQERIYGPNDKLPDKLEFKGHGGTNIQAGIGYLEEKKYPLDGLLIFTDGYTSPKPMQSKLNVKAITMITSEDCLKDTVNFGEVIHVECR